MDEKEELEHELQCVQYRLKMLDIMKEKLLQMKLLAEQAKQSNFIPGELEALNTKLNNLVAQVRVLDEESRRWGNIRMSISGGGNSCH